LMEAVSICNMFVPKGQDIVYAKSRLEEWNRTFSTKDAPHNTQIPLIVLVNENSASASEIVSGALQDLDRAVIVGRKSFGKGLVQNTKDIEAFRVQIKYTTAKYYIPSGRCIQALEYDGGKAIEIPDSLKKVFKTKNQRPVYDGAGISPDVKVEASKESAIARLLRYNLIISDFANVYYNQHDSIPPAKQFRLTDKEFEEFIEFVSKQPRALSETEKLVSQALAQKMENTSNENALKTIQTRLQTNQIADIRKNKPELMSLLEREIASRYYYENGRIEIQLRDDKDVQEAVNLFKDKAQFKKILGNE
jgi:carboxyl-terminal processing protease